MRLPSKWRGGLFISMLIVAGWLGYRELMGCVESPLPLTAPHLITVVAGSGRQQVLQLLQEQQWVKRPTALRWFWRFHPKLAQFKAGTYRVLPGMSLRGLLQQFQQGTVAQFSIRFVEGSRYQQWCQILNTAPYLQHTLLDQPAEAAAELLGLAHSHIEGWLFPDTYYYTAGTSDVELLRRAHQRMQEQLAAVWENRHPQHPLKTPYELLILASIIEKETAVATERPTVASVFINRLRRGMRLQACPTVIYGLSAPYTGSLTYAMTRQAHRYNTYRVPGLPPTPIAMPGRAALEAAARPAETPYLYFVANQEGGHTFNHDFAAHRQATRNFQRSKPLVTR